jgi:mono/diheme cytochrome c family protein
MMAKHWFVIATMAVAGAATAATTSAPGAKIFNDLCTACHTVGGGATVGPDLAGVAAKPRADIETAVKRMQDNVGPLKPEQIDALVALLRSADAKTQIAEASNPPAAVEVSKEERAASATIGRMLFFGEAPLTNRGVPCAGCHTFGARGGTLAADLTSAQQRRGDAAVLSAAVQPPFPLMKAAYGAHPVTKQEAYHLLAFLQRPPAPDHPDRVRGMAGGITILVLGGVALIFRSRRSGVRSRMVHK